MIQHQITMPKVAVEALTVDVRQQVVKLVEIRQGVRSQKFVRSIASSRRKNNSKKLIRKSLMNGLSKTIIDLRRVIPHC